MRIPRSSNYDENRQLNKDPDGIRSCVVCGQPVPAGRVRYMVECANGLEECVMPGLTDATKQSYVGCYPLGSDCLAEHPELKPFVIKVAARGEKKSKKAIAKKKLVKSKRS